jgi:hypothetical protein
VILARMTRLTRRATARTHARLTTCFMPRHWPPFAQVAAWLTVVLRQVSDENVLAQLPGPAATQVQLCTSALDAVAGETAWPWVDARGGCESGKVNTVKEVSRDCTGELSSRWPCGRNGSVPDAWRDRTTSWVCQTARLLPLCARLVILCAMRGAVPRSYLPSGLTDDGIYPRAHRTPAGADALVLVTGWKEFEALDMQAVYARMTRPAFVFDSRGVFDPAQLEAIGFSVYRIGKPRPVPHSH